jgi:hypothetical protein
MERNRRFSSRLAMFSKSLRVGGPNGRSGTRGGLLELRRTNCSTPYRWRVALAEPLQGPERLMAGAGANKPSKLGRPAGPAKATDLVARKP